VRINGEDGITASHAVNGAVSCIIQVTSRKLKENRIAIPAQKALELEAVYEYTLS